MSVVSDYFSAPSDQAAARAVTDDLYQPPYDVLQMRDLFPDYHLVPVEVFLTGRSAEAVTEGPRHGRLLASADDDAVVVLTVSDELTAGLAAAGSDQIAAAAESWSRFEDFQGKDTSGLAGFLGELAGLARRATARKEHLYCLIACLPARISQCLSSTTINTGHPVSTAAPETRWHRADQVTPCHRHPGGLPG